MESIWKKLSEASAEGKSEKRTIPDRRQWDVIIVGAGMAGLLTGYYLKERGKDVLIVEADEIASGQTGKTTAKITSQHGLKYAGLIKKIGRKKAELYARANEAAIEEYERLIKKHGIDCGFERLPAYLYSLENEAQLYEEAEAAKSLGIDAEFTKETELPFAVAGAVCFQNQAQFSPLLFVRQIARQLQILEHTKVLRIRGNKVFTKDAVMTADKIIVATHYPILNVPGFYFVRQHQERSYALALSGCERIHGMYYGVDKTGLSIRMAGDMLLLGGGASRTGENTKGGAYEFLERAAKRYFPKGEEVCRWSAQDCMPHDGVPFIGKYSLFTPRIFVVTGFQKWGMTTAMIAAMIMREELCGGKSPYHTLFRPQRIYLRAGIGKLFTDIGMSVKGLLKGLLHRPGKEAAALEKGQGEIVLFGGKRYACYKDETGEIHKIPAACPHLGCELTWNPDEKSWDCPCHGSRFDMDGNLLDNPAIHDAKKTG